MTNTTPPGPEKEKHTFSEKFETLKKNEKVEHFCSYAKTNTRDIIAYIVLIIGLFLLFFQPIYGAALIGMVFGLYYAKEILTYLREFKTRFNQQEMVKTLIAVGTLLGIFIVMPMLVIGAALIVALKFILFPEKDLT